MKRFDRVQTHPATDAWMRGQRYGTVISLLDGGKLVRVKMDIGSKTIVFRASDLIVTGKGGSDA